MWNGMFAGVKERIDCHYVEVEKDKVLSLYDTEPVEVFYIDYGGMDSLIESREQLIRLIEDDECWFGVGR